MQYTDSKENSEKLQGGATHTATPRDTDNSAIIALNNRTLQRIEEIKEGATLDFGADNGAVNGLIDLKIAAVLEGVSRQAMDKKAKRNHWQTFDGETVTGGKKLLISIDNLTPEAQRRYKEHLQLHNKELPGYDELEFENYSFEDKRAALAKEAALKVYRQYRKDGRAKGLKYADIDKRFEAALKAGEILTQEYLKLDGFTASTVYQWHKAYAGAGENLVVLVPKRKGRAGRPPIVDFEEHAWRAARMILLMSPTLKVKTAYHMVYAKFDKAPCYSSFLNWANTQRQINNQAMKSLTGPKTKSEAAYKIYRHNDAMPGDLWQSDGYELKVRVYSPAPYDNDFKNRRLVNPLIIYWLDVATQCITGWAASCKERGDVVASAWIDALEKWPVPKGVMFDNGSAYLNVQCSPEKILSRKTKTFTEKKQEAQHFIDNDYHGYFKEAGVEKITYVTPGHAWAKKIEPANRYIFNGFEELMPTYTGKGPSDRPERMQVTDMALIKRNGDSIMSWEELIDKLATYIEWKNNQPSEYLGGFSPAEAYRSFVDEFPERPKLSPEAISVKCAWREVLTVKNSSVLIHGNYYSAPELSFWERKKVMVFYDVRNLKTARIALLDGSELPIIARQTVYGSYTKDSVDAIKWAKWMQDKIGNLSATALLENPHNLTIKELKQLQRKANELPVEQRIALDKALNEAGKYPNGFLADAPKRKKPAVAPLPEPPKYTGLTYVDIAGKIEEPEFEQEKPFNLDDIEVHNVEDKPQDGAQTAQYDVLEDLEQDDNDDPAKKLRLLAGMHG